MVSQGVIVYILCHQYLGSSVTFGLNVEATFWALMIIGAHTIIFTFAILQG